MTRPSAPLLVCIGNLTIDEAVQPDGGRSMELGGDAVYAALAARPGGARVRWLAPVGDDLPATLLDQLAAAGLPADDPLRRGAPTVRYRVTYRGDGSRVWELVHGEDHFDLMSVHPADVPAWVLNADGILVCGMSLGSQLALVRMLAASTRATIYLDLQEEYLDGNLPALREMVRGCDVFMPSEVEATALAGTDDLPRAIRALADLGPRVVVIKRAERGCMVLDGRDGRITEVPAEPAGVVDATGAGDAFCGGFAAAHLCGADPVAAARAGAAAARVALAAHGMRGLLAAAA